MPQPGRLRQLWFRWKALDLPWRKQWLRGFDLAGNSFWEFKETYGAQRFRRIVKYSRRTHYGDIKLTPQWIQWLRHTRSDPPTIAEQQLDEIRQAQLKQLAAAADARWAAKPSALDPPPQPEPTPQLQSRDPAANAPQTEPEEREGVRNVAAAPNQVKARMEDQENVDKGRSKGEKKKEKTPSPWDEAKSQEWQPAPWTPKITRRRG
ncbi:NADH-ubiquinone oxidoreductase assembly factor N7BML [Lasiodiplodia hormozganensis]|uniref:NADH-ubiquinone oxidoreductase assembly factor N7BML n=1 Tax=Lasiodiplodia hormozganensis TaxID=869390 RepID=A0AA39XPC6_9PEZI|nr:NADH-ubiquinone oxidoreductase assembly factor N7BML [Lasiodiplodia hormozganensis]